MQKFFVQTSSLLVLIFCFFSKEIFSQPLEELIRKTQQRYQEIASFSGSFSQKNYLMDQKEPKIATGRVAYVRPGKMRWNYDPPNEQLLVTDGKTVWLHDPILENVTIQELDEVAQGTVLSFFLGVGDLSKDFTSRSTTQNLIQDKSLLTIELVPKHTLANIAYLQLGVSAKTYDLLKIAIIDRQENYQVMEFQNLQYNKEMDISIFKFEVTADMEVITPSF